MLFSDTATSELRSRCKGENSPSVLPQQLPAIGIRFELAEERQGHTWELTVVEEVNETQCLALFSTCKFCSISPTFPKGRRDINCP